MTGILLRALGTCKCPDGSEELAPCEDPVACAYEGGASEGPSLSVIVVCVSWPCFNTTCISFHSGRLEDDVQEE